MMKIIHLLLLCFVLPSYSPPQDHSKELNLYKLMPKTLKLVGDQAVIIGDSIEGALKDYVVKIHDWEFYDSPKRICEDIMWNVSRNNKFVMRSVRTICHVLFNVSFEEIRAVMSRWCHLLGFTTAYGIGVWVAFSSGYFSGKYLPKQQVSMMLNHRNMVCFRATAYCVGAALLGFLTSRETRTEVFSNKMVMFQVFILVSALCMMLTNLMFLEPRATKCIVQRKREMWQTKSLAAEKLKKMNSYSLILSVSTVVVLTWHLAYIGQMTL